MQYDKVYSLSRRFSAILIGVVTILLILFAASAILINLSESEKALQNRLSNTFSLARIASLGLALPPRCGISIMM
ncbi:hypothetical protein C2W62_01600 [Candidatus Entotheonella serta]|nr:hypothetical protein C2W62_01600 [Candidatus Entotheonella serta]